jgi:hypothetical protein
MHWLGDVLELLRAGIETQIRPGSASACSRAATLTASPNPDAKQHAPVGRQSLVRLADRLLDRQCTGKPVGDTRELGQHRVHRRVGDAAAIFRDPRRSDLPAPGQ